MTSGGFQHRLPAGGHAGRPLLPTTRLGRRALALAAASVITSFAWRVMGPLGGFPSLVLGVASGIVALVAIIRRGERSATAFLALLPFAGAVVFVLAEFLVGHG